MTSTSPFALQQLTSLSVDPDGVVLELTDPRTCSTIPFLYMIEPGELIFSYA